MQTSLSLLNHPRDVHIEHFLVDGRVNTMNERASDPLNKLYERAAPNAILNGGGRADDVRCYPGTREEVIGKIEHWKDRKPDYTSRMMWLSGPAGAGKTAIIQSVAEKWKKSGVSTASFFFFRGDGTRNTAKPLAATLLYQLIDLIPALKQSMADLLSSKPLITEASIHDQMMGFIDTPIHTLIHQKSIDVQTPIVLLIDGLDECSSDDKIIQERVLTALQDLVSPEDSPFVALVASRREPNLIMAFRKLSLKLGSIFLDDDYRPAEDIHLFVAAKFDEIKRTHHLSNRLNKEWPLDADIDNITNKSSGQFIYAATVMRFLEYSPESPNITLKIVQGIQPLEDHSPFAQIDAMYSYIFSQARSLDTIKEMFAMHLIGSAYNSMFDNSTNLFDDFLPAVCDVTSVESLISPLASMIRMEHSSEGMRLIFYHASLGDFLQDESRSRTYFVDVHATRVWWNIRLLRSGANTVFQRLLHSLEDNAGDLSVQQTYEQRLNADTIKGIYEQFANSDRGRYKRFLKRWIFLTLYYDLPLPSRGKAYPYYRRYNLWTQLKLQVVRRVCKHRRHRSFHDDACSVCVRRYFDLSSDYLSDSDS